MNVVFYIFWSLLNLVYSSNNFEEICQSTTKQGALQGAHMVSRDGRIFCAFLGIPYAGAPIKELRFKPPSFPARWEGVRDATKEAEICLQRGFGGSEDCLYLNVFTHDTNTNRSLAVMVYIPSGGFYIGSSSTSILGPEYLMDRDIVLVTFQYRLGPFGFLSTGDEVVSGNMGLKDQVKALQWVQENINSFGGDPAKVTIFGNSAGGASVHYHMQSPLSSHLFIRAISQSGTAYSRFALTSQKTSKNTTNKLAISLNCSISSSIEVLQCLQSQSALDILAAYNEILNTMYSHRILLRPVVENNITDAFITVNSLNKKTEIPWLIGVNTNEGIFTIPNKRLELILNVTKTQFISFCSEILLFEDACKNKIEAANAIHNFYFKNTSSTNDIIRSLEEVVTDSWFIWPTEKAIEQHNGSAYYYLYDHHSVHSFTEILHCPGGFGVSHMDDVLVLFKQKDIFPKLNEQDSIISKLMVDFWVNFATYGKPTPNPVNSNPQSKQSGPFTWEVTSSTDPLYLHIQSNKLSMKNKMFNHRQEFWREIQQRYF